MFTPCANFNNMTAQNSKNLFSSKLFYEFLLKDNKKIQQKKPGKRIRQLNLFKMSLTIAKDLSR